MLKKIEEHSKQIPHEVRLIIAALDNPIRQAILVLLTENKELTPLGCRILSSLNNALIPPAPN
jgi:hypothetical protein